MLRSPSTGYSLNYKGKSELQAVSKKQPQSHQDSNNFNSFERKKKSGHKPVNLYVFSYSDISSNTSARLPHY